MIFIYFSAIHFHISLSSLFARFLGVSNRLSSSRVRFISYTLGRCITSSYVIFDTHVSKQTCSHFTTIPSLLFYTITYDSIFCSIVVRIFFTDIILMYQTISTKHKSYQMPIQSNTIFHFIEIVIPEVKHQKKPNSLSGPFLSIECCVQMFDRLWSRLWRWMVIVCPIYAMSS